MDQGEVFARLVKLTGAESLQLAFKPLLVSDGRLKGDRIALRYGIPIDAMNYNLAHELAHHFLHYDKGNTIDSENMMNTRNRQTGRRKCCCRLSL